MLLMTRAASLALAIWVTGLAAYAQSPLTELLQRHGVQANGGFAAAFDAHAAPAVPVTPGSFATPLALLTSSSGSEQIDAAYVFGILGGRSGRAASPPELAAAGHALVAMIGSEDRKSRIAAARVAGRLFAAPFDPSGEERDAMLDGYRQIAADAGVRVSVVFCVCARVADVDQMLGPSTLLIVGGRSRAWWPTRERRLMDRLVGQGYPVIFADVGAAHRRGIDVPRAFRNS